MQNYFSDNDDLRYYFDKGIDWKPIFKATERGGDDGPETVEEAVDIYRDILEMVGQFVATELAPHAATIDRKGVRLENGEAVSPEELDRVFAQIKDLDLHQLCIPRELGGMNCPLLLSFLVGEVFARGDVSTMTHHGFHGGMALSMLAYSMREGTTKFDDDGKIVETRFREELEEIARGDAWGSMDITEPDAGSDMAALRAHAEQDEQGNWYVTGQKIFITSGHGKYHFVIARTEKAESEDDPKAGLGGMSFFLVPAYEDENGNRRRIVTIDRVEEKLGHHGSCTAALTFERAPAHLIGERGQGFKYMLVLMNLARLAVGFEAIGLCENAYRLAREYAAERPSMGKTIDRHEMIADYLEEMATDIQGLRALGIAAGTAEELGFKYQAFADHICKDEATAKRFRSLARRQQAEARRLTPLLKYLASEKAVESSRRCIQIHGGNGYMKEYGAEKLLRDSLVLPIYEGTSQIQSLMVMKDTLGAALKAPQDFVKRLAQARWRSLSARRPLQRRVAKLQVLAFDVQQHLLRRTATDKFRAISDRPLSEWTQALFKQWNPKRDFAFAMLHAERLTLLLTDVAICELLLQQAQRHPERAEVLERYLERAEPRCRYLHDQITSTGDGLLARLGASDKAVPAEAAE